MMLRSHALISAAIAAAATVFSVSVAEAAPGTVTGDVNLRTGPGVAYPRLATIPRSSPIEIANCQSWCFVYWRGVSGWVAASYVRWGGYATPPTYGPPSIYVPPSIYLGPNLPFSFGFGFAQQPGYWYYPNP